MNKLCGLNSPGRVLVVGLVELEVLTLMLLAGTWFPTDGPSSPKKSRSNGPVFLLEARPWLRNWVYATFGVTVFGERMHHRASVPWREVTATLIALTGTIKACAKLLWVIARLITHSG